jgi:hypothetical protein
MVSNRRLAAMSEHTSTLQYEIKGGMALSYSSQYSKRMQDPNFWQVFSDISVTITPGKGQGFTFMGVNIQVPPMPIEVAKFIVQHSYLLLAFLPQVPMRGAKSE